MSWLFSSGGQSIRASASASILPGNIQDWFPLWLNGLISLQSKGLSACKSWIPHVGCGALIIYLPSDPPSRGSLLFPEHIGYAPPQGICLDCFPCLECSSPGCPRTLPHFRILFKCYGIREIVSGYLYNTFPSPSLACLHPFIYSSLPY